MNPLEIGVPNLPYNLILSLVISVVIGFAFAFFRGAGLGRLIFSVMASIAGFYAGQFIANYFQWSFFMWNGVHLIEGVVGSLVALWIVNS
jgi:uncharacterized membrane protein YeaQ/YmgE (transglycosylase-associated protein family)